MRPLAVVLALLAAPVAHAADGVARLPGGVTARVVNHQLELRRGPERATLPLPGDVSDVLGSSGDPVTLRLERICPPPLALTLTAAEIEARFLLAGAQAQLKKGDVTAALAGLRRAVTDAPGQVDVRLALARVLPPDEAVATLRAGLEVAPLETAWGVLTDHALAPLAPRLGLPVAGGPPVTAGAWSPSRRWFAIAAETGPLRVVDEQGRTVFTAPLTLAADLDPGGAPTARARPRVQARMRAARRLLAWFDFVALERAGRAEAGSSGDPSLSQLRWKEPGLVASAGGTVLRLRRQGAVVFERKLDTVGTIGLDWGHHLPQDQLVVMGWSRRSGNDECPEGDGLVVARLP